MPALTFQQMVRESSAYGSMASAPPLPAPGRSVLDTLGFLQVFGSPLDTLFFHSWPDEINEGLTTQWVQLPFAGASAPLAYLYMGNQWDAHSVTLNFHTSNPHDSLKFRGPRGSPQFIGQAIIDLLRIQMQVAWCKSICLPNTDRIAKEAKKVVDAVTGSEGLVSAFGAGVKALASGASALGADFASAIERGGLDRALYGGGLFPPLIAIQYGGFLRIYGFCNSLQIRWLPPFTPLTAHPHRADVTLNFARFFPFVRTPNRTAARTKFGFMI